MSESWQTQHSLAYASGEEGQGLAQHNTQRVRQNWLHAEWGRGIWGCASGKGAGPGTGQGWVCPGAVYRCHRAGNVKQDRMCSRGTVKQTGPGETRNASRQSMSERQGHVCLGGLGRGGLTGTMVQDKQVVGVFWRVGQGRLSQASVRGWSLAFLGR